MVNAQPFISGKYPNRGPSVLASAQIPLFQLSDPAQFARVQDGARLEISGTGLLQNGVYLDTLTLWDEAKLAAATAAARANLGAELEKFARNTLQYLDADKDLLLDPTDVPPLRRVKLAGRHALVVVRGDGYKEDLALMRGYLTDYKPALIAVDGGADALIELGSSPGHNSRRHGQRFRRRPALRGAAHCSCLQKRRCAGAGTGQGAGADCRLVFRAGNKRRRALCCWRMSMARI